MANRVGLRTLTGEWDEAITLSAEMGADRDDDPARMARTYLPMILASRGQLKALEPWLSSPEAQSEWRELEVVETLAHAVARWASGQVAEAADLIAAIATELSGVAQLTYVTQLGETLEILWDAERFQLLQDLVSRPASHGTPILAGEIERLRGRLLARGGDLEAALTALDRGLASLRQAKCPYSIARCQVTRAWVLSETGRSGEGGAASAEAREIFGRLQARRWLDLLDGASPQSETALVD